VNRQLRLQLGSPPSHGREDFIVSSSNAEAVRALEAWPAWLGGALALVGPEGSGKTHLAQTWRQRAEAVELKADAAPSDLHDLVGRPVLVEHADRSDPELLFHLINMAAQPGAGLLLTARTAPAAWSTSLPDLRSRLNALAVAELGPPDDELLQGVLEKFFRERHIRPSDDIFSYLLRRMERSVPVALAIVERLDEASDAEHRPVSRALARQILEEDEGTPDLFETRLAEPGGSGDNGR
jgi:chromosomal replication initiation ATPase DnaA